MPLADSLCPLGFAPHSVRPTRCKRCFRDYSDHKKKEEPAQKKEEAKTTSAEGSDDNNSTSERRRRSDVNDDENDNNATGIRRRRSDADTNTTNGDAQNRQRTRNRTSTDDPSKKEDRKSPSPPSSAAATSTTSATTSSSNSTEEKSSEESHKERRRSRQRLQILSAQEVKPEEIPGLGGDDENTSADVAFILQVKTSVRSRDDDDETLSTAFTDFTETTLTYGESVEDLQLQVQQLKTQLEAVEEECVRIVKDRDELMEKRQKDQTELQQIDKNNLELSKLTLRVRELETSNEDLKDENNILKLEMKEAQEEVDKRPSEEEVHNQVEELRTKLIAAETLCEELMEENEDIKREIRDLEDEIEEMQDNFREDQADEYSNLKKELEQTAKNCRVLQFKLRKAEKKCDHLESDKNQYEDKLKGIMKGGRLDVDQAEKLRQMELELKTAREVSVNMHTEVESLQNKLRHLQEEKEALAKKGGDGSKSPSPVKKELKPEIHPPKDDKLDVDSAQLLRDLHDTMERENDLKEQFRFAEEESETLRKKVSFLEQENETLVLQLKKMATSASKKGKEKISRPPSREGDREDGKTTPDAEEADNLSALSPAEAQLQLEIMDEETRVLRRKVESLDSENQTLQKQVRELQDRLAEKPSLKIDLPKSPPADPKQANIFYEQKVKLLENEAKELRIKLIDKERDNERLSNELSLKQRKGSQATMMTRSRSLDSDTQVDIKKQLQLVEQEALILRTKTLELENENDKLSSENHRLQLRVGKKPPLTSQEELAADNNQLREKIQNLEKKLTSSQENLSEPSEASAHMASMKEQMLHLERETVSLKSKVETLTKENDKLGNQLRILSEKSTVDVKKRKKIPDAAPKAEFKKAVEELEAELSKMSASLSSKQTQLDLLTTQVSEHRKTTELLSDEKATLERKLKQQILELEKMNQNLKSELKTEKDSMTKLQLDAGKKSPDPKFRDALDKNLKLEKEVGQLKKDLEAEKQKKPSTTVRFEDLRKAEEDKHKLQKEVAEHQRRLSEADKKVSELEQASKESEKAQRSLRHKIDDVTSELDQEKAKLKKVDSRQNEVAMGWLKERDEFKKQVADLQKKSEKLKKEMDEKDKLLNEKDLTMLTEKKKKDGLQLTIRQKEDDLKHSKESNSKLKSKLKELEEKFIKVDNDMAELTDKWRKLDALYKKEKGEWSSRQQDLESQIKLEVKKRERAEQEAERELRDRDDEMITMREKLRRVEAEARKAASSVKDGPVSPQAQEKVSALQKQLDEEKREYDDLTSKYEMLEEEHVVTKARLVMEKEQLQVNCETVQREFSQLDSELKTIRDTFNLRQDTWIKEKLELQEKIKDVEDKLTIADSAGYQVEAQKFKRMVDEKNGIIEQFRKSERNLKDEVDRLKRQGEDLRSKLSDLERASSRSHGRYGSDTSSQKEYMDLKNNLMKAEIEELRTKLQQEEKVHRSEVTTVKMMNDVKMAQMQDEVQMLHIQIGKFRRERDTFKEMLEGAQRTIMDLKSDSIRRRDGTVNQEVEEAKNKLQETRKLIEKLQDQLDNAERNNSHLKTEFLTEKASWEIKVSEMRAKVNELEESIILQGGKSRIFGVKTKLELAWQKEREEQQRLLNESHRMAKELRQRVIDLENERDRERADAKSQLQQLKSTVDADQAETQIKISELQSDLLELRDAHSKMRTTNDRIKREKEKYERDRDELKMKLQETQHFQSEDYAKISSVADELSRLAKLMPTLLGQGADARPPSRPATPTSDKKLQESFQSTLSKVTKLAEEFRRSFGIREEERLKRNLSFRRALSATDSDLEPSKPPSTPTRSRKDDPLSRWQNPQRVSNLPPTPPSMYITPPRQRTAASTALHRKSLSLDQSLAAEMEAGIWKASESGGSASSLQDVGVIHSRSRSSGGDYASGGSNTLAVPGAGPSPVPRRKKRLQSSQSSLESSPSTSRDASMEKELRPSPAPSPVPSAEGLRRTAKDRFFAAGKSRSVEETPTGERIAQAGLEALKPAVGAHVPSELSSRQDDKSKDFKAKISNIFTKKPPLSREGSLDSAESRLKSSSSSTASKGLRPPDPRQKAQYRSTGALHATTVRTLPK